ncbi:MAG: phosphodiester glycosidase family protein [Armatimonadetes bacterium]|nr:phosphodiester glycosidase family protein [Armatimonadota bacterium]
MRFTGRRRSFWMLSIAATTLVIGGGALYSRFRAHESREIKEISPGISLLSVSTTTPNGPLRYWLVKADKAGWELGLEVADARDVIEKRSVRDLAAQSGATVAINGGFFAYGGAAVGAVKVGGEWHRLPWKNRTALGWSETNARIGPLAGSCQLTLTLADGEKQIKNAALNGFALSGTHTPLVDGFCILTPRFGAKYKRKLGDVIAEFSNGQRILRAPNELPDEIEVPADGFLVLARGQAVETLSQTQNASWKAIAHPASFDKSPQILGAGPRLIENSLVKTTEVEEEFRPDVVARGPRTAMGWDEDRNWLLLVADGRQVASAGLTIPETAQLFRELGAVEALNLDGGSSTQLVINGELVNLPSGYDPVNPMRQREVSVTNALVLKPRGFRGTPR